MILIKRFKPLRLDRFLVRILYIILDIYYDDTICENNSRTYLLVHICRLYIYIRVARRRRRAQIRFYKMRVIKSEQSEIRLGL